MFEGGYLSYITESVYANAVSRFQTHGLKAGDELSNNRSCLISGKRLFRTISMNVYFPVLIVIMTAKCP